MFFALRILLAACFKCCITIISFYFTELYLVLLNYYGTLWCIFIEDTVRLELCINSYLRIRVNLILDLIKVQGVFRLRFLKYPKIFIRFAVWLLFWAELSKSFDWVLIVNILSWETMLILNEFIIVLCCSWDLLLVYLGVLLILSYQIILQNMRIFSSFQFSCIRFIIMR